MHQARPEHFLFPFLLSTLLLGEGGVLGCAISAFVRVQGLQAAGGQPIIPPPLKVVHSCCVYRCTRGFPIMMLARGGGLFQRERERGLADFVVEGLSDVGLSP